jgi:hypothetical protein
MKDSFLGTRRPFVIDPEGRLRLAPALGLPDRPADIRRPELAYDQVRVWRTERGLRVRFRPDRTSAQALTRLLYLLAEWPSRVALEYSTDAWKHELVSTGQAAVARVVALDAMRADDTGAVLFESVEPGLLRDQSPLHDLVDHWTARLGWRDFACFVDRASERASGRFVLFEHDRDRNTFLFREFGAGIPEWAKYSLATFRGRALGDLHGDQFGRSCTVAYRDALEKLSPTVQRVDANIRWPRYGTRRSCYWRLVLPVADPAGRLWLLSATLADAAIDLRKTG